MTTTELIKWASKAQDLQENSWNNATNKYDILLRPAIYNAMPEGATEVEFEMAELLVTLAWNEVIEWKTTLKL